MGVKIFKDRDLDAMEIEDFDDNQVDHKLVQKLVRIGRLAPLYTGWTDAPCFDKASVRSVPCFISRNPFLPKAFARLSRYEDVTECPICLLYYPISINYSRCCGQPICTRCFLRLRRSSRLPLQSPVCPFCVQPDFGVIHIPPIYSNNYEAMRRRRKDSLLQKKLENKGARRRKLGYKDPDVVLVDEVRPGWHKLVKVTSGGSLRSGNGTTRRTVARPNQGSAGSVRRVRASHSPYYGNAADDSVDWQLDEQARVIDAIRELTLKQSTTATE